MLLCDAPPCGLQPNRVPHLQSARLRARSEQDVTGEDDESDVSEESEIEEELGFFSLIDAINPYTTFKQALTSKSYSN
jgi:hypothetical protein